MVDMIRPRVNEVKIDHKNTKTQIFPREIQGKMPGHELRKQMQKTADERMARIEAKSRSPLATLRLPRFHFNGD